MGFLDTLKQNYDAAKKKVKSLEEGPGSPHYMEGPFRGKEVDAAKDQERQRIKDSLDAKRRQDMKSDRSRYGG